MPLTEYCDRQRLTVKARLELFVAVCQAVQHAHQKGIIHRDLKPGNVLVTEVDGRPTPKVIDFGVAKATELKLTDMSFADIGAIVGTPTYMSPEQADPSSMDIDTRTDVYALGVMLYELLTGSPPIDAKQFKRGAILEMLRMVREVDPPRPSTKLSTADALPNIAANRSIEPARLSKLLQGELDWVVMKALEKDRTRRYDTANGFARDIQRYLADEVVEARAAEPRLPAEEVRQAEQDPGDRGELGLPGTGRRHHRHEHRDGARPKRPQKAEAVQRGIADTERGDDARGQRRGRRPARRRSWPRPRPRQIERLPHQATCSPRPSLRTMRLRTSSPTSRTSTGRPRRWGTRLDGPTGELEREIRSTILNTYHGLAPGRLERSACHRSTRCGRREPQFGPRSGSRHARAHVLGHRGRQDAEVLEMLETAAKGLEQTLGPTTPPPSTTMTNLASAYLNAGKTWTRPCRSCEEHLATCRRPSSAPTTPPPSPPDRPCMATSPPGSGTRPCRPRRGAPLMARAKLGPDHPATLKSMSYLARPTGRREAGQGPAAPGGDARPCKAKLGPDHPHTLST